MSVHSVIAPIPVEVTGRSATIALRSAERQKSIGRTDVTTRQILSYRPLDGVTQYFDDRFDLYGGQRVVVHESVHGGEDVSRGGRVQSTQN